MKNSTDEYLLKLVQICFIESYIHYKLFKTFAKERKKYGLDCQDLAIMYALNLTEMYGMTRMMNDMFNVLNLVSKGKDFQLQLRIKQCVDERIKSYKKAFSKQSNTNVTMLTTMIKNVVKRVIGSEFELIK
jgi:hypothetical protein